MGTRKKISADKRKEALKATYFAKLQNVPTSPRKMRLVVDMIRGMEVNKALGVLRFSSKEASSRVEKLLRSAIANWEQKNERKAEGGELFVTKVFVDCGSTLKRQVSYKKKIVWCCSKYIKEGKVACRGMRVPEVDISNWVITSPVTVIERDGNEEKYYSYSGQESEDQRSSSGQEENQGSRILSSVHRPRRTAIKL